jgi:hypothetical protein
MQKKQPRTSSRHRPPFATSSLTTASSGHQSPHGTGSIDVSEAWMLAVLLLTLVLALDERGRAEFVAGEQAISDPATRRRLTVLPPGYIEWLIPRDDWMRHRAAWRIRCT